MSRQSQRTKTAFFISPPSNTCSFIAFVAALSGESQKKNVKALESAIENTEKKNKLISWDMLRNFFFLLVLCESTNQKLKEFL